MQSKAGGNVMGESSLRERLNCIIFPTSSAKLALDGENEVAQFYLSYVTFFSSIKKGNFLASPFSPPN